MQPGCVYGWRQWESQGLKMDNNKQTFHVLLLHSIQIIVSESIFKELFTMQLFSLEEILKCDHKKWFIEQYFP